MKRLLITLITVMTFLTTNAQNPEYITIEKTDTSAPSLNFKNSNGFWHISGPRSGESNNNLSIFWNNGTYNRMVTLLDNGKLGIGTSNPSSLLDVVSSNNNKTRINYVDTPSISFIPNNGNSHFHISHTLDNRLTISEGANLGNSKLLTIVNSGNVGIGTTSPGGKLEILKDADLSSSITIPNSGLILRADDDGNDATLRFGVDNANLKALIQTQQTTTAAKFDLLINPFGGNVGIGTASPSNKLEVNGTTGVQDAIVIQKGSSYRIALNGTNDAYINGRNSSFENKFTISSNGNSYFNGGNVGIGTTSPDSKLAVNGTIHAKEVKVDLSVPGPDYVFKEGYGLKSLEEVQNYIKENGHLPNIPSAKEMEANGIQLGAMNMKLLEKIEEQMLYIFQLQDQVLEQKRELDLLKEKLNKE